MVLDLIKVVFVTITTVISSVFSPPVSISPPLSSITPTEAPRIVTTKFFTASTTVEENNATVKITVQLPVNGGNITGNVDGFCEGALTGVYDGQEAGKISGNLNGTCGYFILRTPATATFDGVVYKIKGEIPINYMAKAENNLKTGNVTLHFTPLQ